MNRTYSTAQVAKRLGVSVQTVQRWADLGRLRAWVTPGGHRRIDAGDAEAMFLSRKRPLPGESLSAPPSLLLVDDSPRDLELTAALVERALPGADVFSVDNGFDALLQVGRRHFDVLISDVVMPHMDGFEMLRRLAALDPPRPRHLLATSSHSLDELAARGGLPGGVAFMPKPLQLEPLAAWLSQRLNQPA